MNHAHVVPPRVYLVVYLALMVLMGLTVFIAHYQLGPMNNVAAVSIAVVKAVLVVLFFMQVRYSSKLTWVWASVGFVWLVILFSTLADYVARGWIQTQGWSPLP